MFLTSYKGFGQCSNIDFSANTTTGCAPLVVQFSATGFSTGSMFSWDFGIGAIVGADTITKVFTVPGKYTINLIVTPSGGAPCPTVTKVDYIEVLPTPIPTFTVSPGSTICNGAKTVTFTDNTPNVTNREWIIDGTSFKNASSVVSYTFSSAGFKSVSLKVTNSAGCTGLFNDNKYIKIYDSATVDYCANVTVTGLSAKAKFTANVPIPAGGRIISSYNWAFPGGSPSTYKGKYPPTISYTDISPGYEVSLTINMADGCSYTLTRKNFIKKYMTLSTGKDTVCINKPFKINDFTSNKDGRKNAFTALPNAAIDPKGNYSYNAAGQFDYQIGFNYGGTTCYDTVKYPGYMNVIGPQAGFMSPNKNACYTNTAIILHNQSNTWGATGLKYTWYIMDSLRNIIKTLTPKDPSGDTLYTPTRGGTFTVKLQASSSNGCTDTISYKSYIVVARPKADFTMDSTKVCAGLLCTIKSKATPPDPGGTYHYTWRIQHSDSVAIFTATTGKDATFQPLIPGQYDITLIVDNFIDPQNKVGGCSDTITKKRFLNVYGIYGSIKVNNTIGCPPMSVNATAQISKFFPPSAVYKYTWDVNPASGVFITDPHSLNTTIYFTIPDCYDLTLSATDPYKCTSQIIRSQAVCVGAKSDFEIRPNKCLGDTTAIKSGADPNAEGYKWLAEPKNAARFIPSDTVRQPSIIFLRDTCVTVKYVVFKHVGGNLCQDTSSRQRCLTLPHAGFTTDDTLMSCAPVVVDLRSTADNIKNGYTWWDFGDGQTLITKSDSVSHVYEKNNNKGFVIKMVAIDSNGCTSDTFTKTSQIRIIGPELHFKMDKKKGCDVANIHFTIDNKKNVNRYLLFYDDGAYTDSINSNHTYDIKKTSDTTTYHVFYPTLVVLDTGNCSLVFFEDTVKLYRSPRAGFISDIKGGCIPLKVNFMDTSHNIQKVWWDFDGDGKWDDSSHNAAFVYKNPGRYNVKLRVMNAGGCYDSILKNQYIEALQIPKAGLAANQNIFCGKGIVNFKNTSKYYTSYKVYYGDQSVPSQDTVIPHFYYFDQSQQKSDSAVFHAYLVAYNIYGCNDTARQTVVIYQSPVADFSSNVTAGCDPLRVYFGDQSLYAVDWKWDFDNDGVYEGSGRSVNWTFTPGYHTVKLRIISRHGCVDSMIKVHYIQVNPQPRVKFAVSDSLVCLHGSVKFTDLSTPKVNLRRWKWYFDDLNPIADTSSIEHPTFTFHRVGLHYVSLVTWDNLGCYDSLTRPAVMVHDTLPAPNSAILYVTLDDSGRAQIVWNHNPLYDFAKYTLTRDSVGIKQIFSSGNVYDTVYTDGESQIASKYFQYCYHIQTTDKCNNVSLPSASHCSILLKTAIAGPSALSLTWTPYNGWMPAKYDIYRSDGAGFALIGSVPGTQTSYTDSGLCDEAYWYYVIARHPNNRYFSRSNTDSNHATYVYQAFPLNLIYATVDNDKDVVLEWEPGMQKNLKQYRIDRYTDGEGWKDSYMITNATTAKDINAQVHERSYTYRVRTEDACGYQSPVSNVGTSIHLWYEVIKDKIILHWTPYQNWSQGVNRYILQVRKRDHKFYTITALAGTETSYIDDSVYTDVDTAYCYRIIAEEKDFTSTQSVSNMTCALLDSRVFVPNAFSPNNDGINDTFKVSALMIYNLVGSKKLDFKMQIYNRWGQRMFESGDLFKGWDGRFEGKAAEMGVYIWYLDATGIDGRSIHLNGKVTLLR